MAQRQLIRTTAETPIGRMMMASDGEALTELCLEDWWWAAKNRQKDNCTPDSELEVFRITRDWLQAYFADKRPSLSQAPPMNPAATPFQHEVWQLVAEIPYGMTASYGEIAAELSERRGGGRMAAQAVGGAVKRNPITIIVPCHRVVGSGRAFGGYGGRLDIKAELLEHEGVDMTRFDLLDIRPV
ncbi:methylated-DNA--[protein]-cysteine S-methyltransferase [Bifidobacterium sp. M3-N-101]|uniref:methylated-DNA--[protein]-cysteine S-methyltransferase n=1 Tax=Bifidobacterium sp. M3-N-101 TaxID=2949653 RepID=UPI00202E3897|nr:methylated-DNA--[protein]-cysteine S-methyltransferase [Bifidobacterium sp. M3-N-101]MCM0691512.1 methylated-DNA--[protein]-cysteine S-methyltransferase [Bifidobacterium sp. M3-N-101]